MIFKLHYWFLASGVNAIGILMGVFIETYTDASSMEIGALLMLMPFTGMIFRPIICSRADREQAHQKYLIICLLIVAISYFPFIVIPLLGPAVYKEHPRICWYFLVSLKIIGDIAFGGVISIGDALAINYSKRIGTDFSVYRVWGTISWMCFGLIIGQVNEIWFMPKYVPGFMILITSSLLDMTIIWLWPEEYFIMVAKDHSKTGEGEKKEEGKKENPLMKSLMPKEVVWAHVKGKLLSLICCCGRTTKDDTPRKEDKMKEFGQNLSSKINMTGSFRDAPNDKSINSPGGQQVMSNKDQNKKCQINKMTQVRILGLLLRRDLRIIPYLMFFVCAGLSIVPLSFFFISLSNICQETGACHFSKLGGLLQATMAIAETILFIYIKRIKSAIGRVNTCALVLLLSAIKYTFYGTIWIQVDPYYSLIAEMLHGVVFGTVLTLMVELGHEFASEVEFILPELIEKGVVAKEAEAERMKLSLAATMQAVISSANEGIGRGFGALVYGLILETYTYETLWLIIGISAFVLFCITIAINLFDYFFHLNLGLDITIKKPLDLEDANRDAELN